MAQYRQQLFDIADLTAQVLLPPFSTAHVPLLLF
jgi:hypothetical protein